MAGALAGTSMSREWPTVSMQRPRIPTAAWRPRSLIARCCGPGMGMGVFQSLTQAGIQPVITDIAAVDEAVAAYLAGTLTNHIERLH